MRWSLRQCELSRTMDFLVILVLTLYITQALTKSRSKKSKASASEEEGSIENLLYYKDCQRNAKPEPSPTPQPLRYVEPPTTPPPPRQPECPFPKMCCALTCGNECGGNQQISHMQPEPFMAPAVGQIRRGRKYAAHPQMDPKMKKKKMPANKKPTRRDFSGFTKEKIKGLIAKDDDIRKILKDLVRVTMQKVDLQDMIDANPDGFSDVSTVRSTSTSTTVDELYMDDYVE